MGSSRRPDAAEGGAEPSTAETVVGRRTPAGAGETGEDTVGETLSTAQLRANRGEALPVGTRAGRYVLLERIGGGGGGQVYAAYDPQLDRKVAIKLLTARADPDTVSDGQARLLREGQAMARLKHPNVLPVYDVGTLRHRDVESVFVAMELVEGGTLRQWLKQRRTRREILEVMIAAGRGLAAAHAAGLVHRDFKPDNVLIDGGGRVFVTDFGIVRAVGATDDPPPSPHSPPADLLATPLTRMDAIVGTPAYMAPEQYQCHAIDARTDQFSFCITLYEALTGERPFRGSTFEQLEQATVAGKITPAARHGEMPPWLRRVVLRGLEADPARRHASMDALLAALAADPARRLRTIVAVAGAVATLALVSAGTARLVSRSHELCAGSERKLAGVWDPSLRAGIERAFAASGVPGADRVASTVSVLLDDYARRWTAMRTDACQATRVRGDQPESVMQLRMSCLDDRLHELGALTNLFQTADAPLVRKSIDATAALSSLQRCADVAALIAPVPPPTDAPTVKKVEAVRARIAEMKALDAGGHSKPLLAEAEALVTTARQLGYGPLLAQTLQMRGDLLDSSGDHQAAEPLLFEAFAVAYAAHDDAAAADVADDLVSLVGYWLARYAEGHRWADLARAAIRRLGGNPELEAWLARDEAWVDYLEGDGKRAVADGERALTLAKRVLPPDSTKLAKIHTTLATAYTMQKRFDESIVQNQAALSIMQRVYGNDHPALGAVLTSLGNASQDQQRFAEAESFHRRALTILEKGNGPDHPTTAFAHSNLGDALAAEKHYAEALRHFQLAEQIEQKRLGNDHPALVNARLGIGTCELALGHAAAATTAFESALAVAEKKGMSNDQLVEVRFGLARSLWDSGRDRARSLSLAESSHADAVRTKDDELAKEIAGWLAAHRR